MIKYTSWKITLFYISQWTKYKFYLLYTLLKIITEDTCECLVYLAFISEMQNALSTKMESQKNHPQKTALKSQLSLLLSLEWLQMQTCPQCKDVSRCNFRWTVLMVTQCYSAGSLQKRWFPCSLYQSLWLCTSVGCSNNVLYF